MSSINFENEGRLYWGNTQIGFRAWDGSTYLEHQDYLGPERLRTNYMGQVASTYNSQAFGDGYTPSVAMTWGGQDDLQFGGLTYDSESMTNHAQFRQYSPTQGRWLSPDPYDGSMDFGNPQSLNRYSYVGNMPLSMTDPSGLDGVSIGGGISKGYGCLGAIASGGSNIEGDIGCGIELVSNILNAIKHPKFHGTASSRPIWDEHSGYTPYASLGDILGLPSGAGCEFGACGARVGQISQAGEAIPRRRSSRCMTTSSNI